MGKINNKLKAKAKKAIALASAKNIKDKVVSASKLDKNDDRDQILHKTAKSQSNIISKKEKIRQKHKKLLNKFSLIRKQQKEERARKNREKTAIVGDLKPLKDSLPALDELIKLSKERKDIHTGIQPTTEADKKLNPKQKLRRKKEQFIRKVNAFEALLRDPDFKKNPRDTISYHIKYTNGLIQEE